MGRRSRSLRAKKTTRERREGRSHRSRGAGREVMESEETQPAAVEEKRWSEEEEEE